MKIVVFASDNKGWSSLNSIVNELVEADHQVFVLVNEHTRLAVPTVHPEMYGQFTNAETNEEIYVHTMGCNIPFHPDWLIVSRERWPPEDAMIDEFKIRFGAKVGLVEPNASALNGVESILENHSRNRFVNKIDVFFDHSTIIKEQRALSDFIGNSVVVGNPKYDNNIIIDEETLEMAREHYAIDKSTKHVLYYTLVNGARGNLFNEFEKYRENHPEYGYFVKPYPGEPWDQSLVPNLTMWALQNGIKPILEEPHIWSLLPICDIHVGAFSSVLYGPYFLGKEVIELSETIGMRARYEDPSPVLESSSEGVESTAELWMRSFGITFDILKGMISDERIKRVCERNNDIWAVVDSGNREEILKLFDDFNDQQAAKRIVEYMETH